MRIALFQCPSHPLDVAGNLQRLESAAIEAAAQGVQLLVCPEMFLSGYNIGEAAVRRLAEAADGPAAAHVAGIARRTGSAIVYGYPERDEQGVIYNAVQLIDNEGKRLCNYRKTHLFGELDRAMFSPGESHFPVVELNGWRLGLLICYDLEFPENARRLALAGAELIAVPTANMVAYPFIAEVTVRSRAYENQCYVAYANYCGREAEIAYCGLSSIAAPDGQALALAGQAQALVIGSLDRQKLEASRQLNPYLQDRRPDLYGSLSKP